MKLLMITRRVDRSDALAGFTYRWIEKLALQVSVLYVICLEKGDVNGLPKHCIVQSLGKESGASRLQRFWRFIILAKKIVSHVDGVFAHQNPEYAILVAPWCKIYKKKLISWYTHKAVTLRRRLMEIMVNRICTASSESFREPLDPLKVAVIGHGIDTEQFKPAQSITTHGAVRLLTIGRISPSKRYENMIKAIVMLKNDITLDIVGDVILESQKSYLSDLKQLVNRENLNDRIRFLGWKPNKDILPFYQNADIFLNMSETGSVDKAVLEAMASGCLVLTSNNAFVTILPKQLLLESSSPEDIAKKINETSDLSDTLKRELRLQLRKIVVEHHNLDKLAARIIEQFSV